MCSWQALLLRRRGGKTRELGCGGGAGESASCKSKWIEGRLSGAGGTLDLEVGP